MKQIFLLTASILAAIVSFNAGAVSNDTKKEISIICHRGYWKCEEAGMSENSIASLRTAQNYAFQGSECDIHLTADSVIIVNHNNDINGKLIAEGKFEDLSRELLPNGEKRPSFDAYLSQAAKAPSVLLVVEFKKQRDTATEDALVDKAMAMLKEKGLYDPQRVAFISFSRHISRKIAAEHPAFTNQFLTSKDLPENAPEKVLAEGINGIDYHHSLFKTHPEWVEQAHSLGMSVNVWTVNKREDMKLMLSLGVDAITTNEPTLLREVLNQL